MHASSNILKTYNAVFHSALRFITGDGFPTSKCFLCRNLGWPPLTIHQEQYSLLFLKFFYWPAPAVYVLISTNQKPPICYVLSDPDKPPINTGAGKESFSYYAQITGMNYETFINRAKLFQSGRR